MRSPWPEESACARGPLVRRVRRGRPVERGRGLLPLLKLVDLVDLLDQLHQLLPFALAHVKETDAHRACVVKGLGDAAEAKGQSLKAEFRLHSSEDAQRKSLVSADARSEE